MPRRNFQGDRQGSHRHRGPGSFDAPDDDLLALLGDAAAAARDAAHDQQARSGRIDLRRFVPSLF